MIKTGVGVGSMWYGIGNTGSANPGAAFLEVLPDATVNLMVGSADIGQGSTTALAQIAAEALGLCYEDIRVISADTMATPEGGATSASRQTFVSGIAVQRAAEQARRPLDAIAAGLLGVGEDALEYRERKVYARGDEEKSITWRQLLAEAGKAGCIPVGAGAYNPQTTPLDPETLEGSPYEVYSYATAVAQVEVDTETGLITLVKVVSAHDVGTVVNRAMAEGQVEGGVVMGQGFALLENVECVNGVIQNPLFSKYLVATAMDAPEIYPLLVETDCESGPFGAKGIGEPALIPVIPAIVDAVEDAIGIRFNKLPITPTDVMRELKAKRERERVAVGTV